MYSFRELMARFKNPAYSLIQHGNDEYIFVYTVPKSKGKRQ